MRDIITTLGELVGLATVAVGIGMIATPLGVIAAGAGLFVVAFEAGRQ